MATLKETFSSAAAFTINLASLAHSTAGAGRQSDVVDNTSNNYIGLWVTANIKMGTSPTINGVVYLYLIRDDNAATPIRDDGAGASDANLTITNATLIGTLRNPDGTTGNALKGSFYVPNPGPKFAIAVLNSSGVALNATAGNHVINYVGETLSIA